MGHIYSPGFNTTSETVSLGEHYGMILGIYILGIIILTVVINLILWCGLKCRCRHCIRRESEPNAAGNVPQPPPANGPPANGPPANGLPANGPPANGPPANGLPAYGAVHVNLQQLLHPLPPPAA